MEKKPTNIFEQIALGLEVTNSNTVAIAEDIAALYRMVEEIHNVLFIKNPSEPNTSGAGQDE